MSASELLSAFQNADPTKTSSGGNYISVAGEFVVEIETVKYKESEQSDKTFLIVEFKVRESNTDTVPVYAPAQGDQPEVGKYAWTHNLLNKWYGLSNAKNFLASACGFESKSPEAQALGRDEMTEAWGEEQPFAGELIKLKTSMRTTKANTDFTAHTWAPA